MKRSIAIGFFLAVAAAAVMAQNVPAAALPEVRIFGLELGIAAGYDVDEGEPVGGTNFSLNFVVADNVVVGVQSLTVTDSTSATNFISYNTFKLAYYLNESIGFAMLAGTDGTDPAAGLGVFYNVARNMPANGLANSYKLNLEYVFPTTDISTGVVALTAGLSLGL